MILLFHNYFNPSLIHRSNNCSTPLLATKNQVLVIKRYTGQEIGHARKVLNAITTKTLPRSQSVPNLRPSLSASQSNITSGSSSNHINSSSLTRAFTLGNLDFRQSTTNVSKPIDIDTSIKRSMAVWTGNHPEQLGVISDAQSLKNNPAIGKKSIRHAETQVQKCQADPNCTKKNCTQVCGTPGDRYVAEHWTHGNPSTQAGTIVPVSQTDYNNNQKAQNAVVYKIPHTTTQTSEIPSLTQFINDPTNRKAVEPHENIP
jgi:hypothetical protein